MHSRFTCDFRCGNKDEILRQCHFFCPCLSNEEWIHSRYGAPWCDDLDFDYDDQKPFLPPPPTLISSPKDSKGGLKTSTTW